MYCTVTDITDTIPHRILIQLTDDDDTGNPDTGRTEKAIRDASNEIDGHVGVKYSTPLSPVPDIIVKFAVDIAVYNLYGRREQGPPDTKVERYENAVSFLKRVATGKASLGISDPGGNPLLDGAPIMSRKNPKRIFTRESMRDF
ncbi:MAG: DUF1320 domain-containing protein [Desulfobacteraceae bacterium]|nr:DUF1320 domain-containing protein [Desulfobacteraceae bacterium]